MIFPIYVYGTPVLRKKAKDIDKNYEGLETLIKNMWETMYKTDGVGLAAPQIGKSIRLFVLDTEALSEDYPEGKGFKKVFINAHVIEEEGEEWSFNEGCLSVPNIREDVKRKTKLRMEYYDENWEYHDEIFEGIQARVMQHEYDHLDGILFTDRISPIRRKLIKGKLLSISKGKAKVKYKTIISK